MATELTVKLQNHFKGSFVMPPPNYATFRVNFIHDDLTISNEIQCRDIMQVMYAAKTLGIPATCRYDWSLAKEDNSPINFKSNGIRLLLRNHYRNKNLEVIIRKVLGPIERVLGFKPIEFTKVVVEADKLWTNYGIFAGGRGLYEGFGITASPEWARDSVHFSIFTLLLKFCLTFGLAVFNDRDINDVFKVFLEDYYPSYRKFKLTNIPSILRSSDKLIIEVTEEDIKNHSTDLYNLQEKVGFMSSMERTKVIREMLSISRKDEDSDLYG